MNFVTSHLAAKSSKACIVKQPNNMKFQTFCHLGYVEKDNKKTCVAIFSNHGQTGMLGNFFRNPKTSVEIQSPKNPQLWISLGNNLKIFGTDQAFYVDTNCDIGEHDKMAAFKPGIPLKARLTCQSGNEIKTNQFPIGNDVPKTVMNHLFESDDCKESPLRIYQNGNWVGYSRLNEIEKDQIVEHSAIIDGKRFTCSFKQSDIKIEKPAQFFQAGLIDYLGQSTSRRLTGPSQQLGNGINPKDNSFYRYLSELSLNVSAIPTATMYVNNTKVPMHVGAVVKQLDNQTNATDVWVMVSNLYSTNHKTDELFIFDFFIPQLKLFFTPMLSLDLQGKWMQAYLIYSSSQNCSNLELENYAKSIDPNPDLSKPMYYRDPCSNGTALIDKPTKCGKLDNFPMPFISEREEVAGVVTYYGSTDLNSMTSPSYGIVYCERDMSLKRYIQSSQGWKRDLEINEESRVALFNIECTGRPFLERVDLRLNDSKTFSSGATGRQLKFSSDRFSILDIVLITTGLGFLIIFVSLLKKKYDKIHQDRFNQQGSNNQSGVQLTESARV